MTLSDDEIKELMKDLGEEYEIKKKKPKNPNQGLSLLLIFNTVLTLLAVFGLIYVIYLLR